MSDNNDKLLNYEGLKYYDEKIKEEIVNSGIGSIIDDSSINDANKTWSAKKISESVGVGKAGTGENSEIFNNYKDNDAYGKYSHAEGLRTHANDFSHAEGLDTQASGDCSHAEGSSTIASGNEAHAEGMNTTASGVNSHAEGYMTIASNIVAHAGGTGSEASKEGSFVHGQVVKASSNNYEVAFGTFNKSNTDTLFSIGNGADEDTRSNAFEITKTTGKLFDKEIATKEDIPTNLPADGGNSATVNGHTVNADVPANAKFTDTDTKYSAGTGISISGTTISNSGVRSVASGSSNGTISVNTGGKAANVAVKGLASAAYQAVQTAAGTVGLHRISSGTAAATTTNCPAGCWYGQYE